MWPTRPNQLGLARRLCKRQRAKPGLARPKNKLGAALFAAAVWQGARPSSMRGQQGLMKVLSSSAFCGMWLLDVGGEVDQQPPAYDWRWLCGLLMCDSDLKGLAAVVWVPEK